MERALGPLLTPLPEEIELTRFKADVGEHGMRHIPQGEGSGEAHLVIEHVASGLADGDAVPGQQAEGLGQLLHPALQLVWGDGPAHQPDPLRFAPGDSPSGNKEVHSPLQPHSQYQVGEGVLSTAGKAEPLAREAELGVLGTDNKVAAHSQHQPTFQAIAMDLSYGQFWMKKDLLEPVAEPVPVHLQSYPLAGAAHPLLAGSEAVEKAYLGQVMAGGEGPPRSLQDHDPY